MEKPPFFNFFGFWGGGRAFVLNVHIFIIVLTCTSALILEKNMVNNLGVADLLP